MNFLLNRSLLAILLLSFAFVACDDDDDEAPNPGPEITITGIENGGSYAAADGLNFTAELSDPDGIASLQVIITRSGIEVLNETEEDEFQDNKTEYTASYATGPIPAELVGSYKVSMIAIDKLGNQSTEEVTLTITE
jgi:hypothetical protein